VSGRVTIVDYGIGNLLSVSRAFANCGAQIELTSDRQKIDAAERLVLPGVGAFGDCMAALTAAKLSETVFAFARSGRPMIGICVGMQMLFEVGEEFGEHKGLELIAGRVVRIPDTDSRGMPHKIPHIGWTAIESPALADHVDWNASILDEVAPGTAMYFLHSYTASPADARNRIADAKYGGRTVSAVVRAGNLWGTQFHPEKSGPDGLRLLRSFIALKPVQPAG